MKTPKTLMIDTTEFLNTCAELHALTNGVCDVICFWPSRRSISQENAQDIAEEYHYYNLGRALGVLAWLGIIALFKQVVF